MKKRRGACVWLLLLLAFSGSSMSSANELIIVNDFQVPQNKAAASILKQRIKTLVARHSKYDFLTPLELKNIINSTFPEQAVDDCTSLDCLLEFQEKLSLRYYIEGIIMIEANQYSSLLILYDLPNEHFYHFRTPLASEQQNSRLIVNAVYHLLGPPPVLAKQVLPQPEEQPKIELFTELQQQQIQKSEQLRRLEIERDNLKNTFEALQEKLGRFNELVYQQEKTP